MPDLAPITKEEIEQMVTEFYRKADAGVETVELLPYVDESAHLYWTPDCQFHGHAGFEEFYDNLRRSIFDRIHRVSNLQCEIDGNGANAKVEFDVHQTATMWHPPLPKSIPVNNQVHFIWQVKRSEKTGHLVFTSYVLTTAYFAEGTALVLAERAFLYDRPLMGPFKYPPENMPQRQ